MEGSSSNLDHRDRTPVLAVIGVLLLLIGMAAAVLGPAELYCFYLFSAGGRFHYEGFGFGSFMFGNIACQIIGYYLIAILFIPLGYGHLKVRRWARTLSLTFLWFWLVVGVPLLVVFLFVAITAKDLSLVVVLIMIVALGLSYLSNEEHPVFRTKSAPYRAVSWPGWPSMPCLMRILGSTTQSNFESS